MKLNPGEYFGDALWSRSFSGLRLTLSTYEPCRVQPWHRHANPTFFLLLVGDHRDLTKHTVYDQAAYTLVYHPPTTTHASELGTGTVRGLNIEFEPECLSGHELGKSNLGEYRTLQSAPTRLAALRFLATAYHPGPRIEMDLEAQAIEFLTLVDCQAIESNAPRWLAKATDILHARFRDSISLRGIALEVGVHPVYFARVFRRAHGRNVSEYLRALRLTEAARLVMQGDSLAHAAYTAGFADQAHFSRCCSNAFGFSPKGLCPARQAFRR
jgi:AraC family transcriptional regulator